MTLGSDAGVRVPVEADAGAAPAEGIGSGLPPNCAVVAHGGVGTPPAESSTVLGAVHRALEALIAGRSPVAAAAVGTAALEDSSVFNAGTGSSVRLDGTIQMDARIMVGSGQGSAVLGIERVRNPVMTALALSGTQHPLLIGDGATRFARQQGQPPYDPATEVAHQRRRAGLDALGWHADAGAPTWAALNRGFSRQPDAGVETAAPAGLEAPGSVAVLIRLSHDRFAGAVSDGGEVATLRGNVGPVAESGRALFVGSRGAVAVSGTVRDGPRAGLARAVYERMQSIGSAKAAAEWGLREAGPRAAVGISALNSLGVHSTATRPMAWVTWSNGAIRTGALARP